MPKNYTIFVPMAPTPMFCFNKDTYREFIHERLSATAENVSSFRFHGHKIDTEYAYHIQEYIEKRLDKAHLKW